MGQRSAVIPSEGASAAETFAWYALNHWGTGPGRLFPADTTPGWHAYSEIEGTVLDERLQLESATEARGLVTLVFAQRSRRLVVLVEPDAGKAASDVLSSLWEILTPLAEHTDAWRETTIPISDSTFLLNPTVWPGHPTTGA